MQKDIQYLDSLIRNCTERQIGAVSLFLVAVVATLEYLAGYELAISTFLLIPIALAAWYGSRNQGIFFSALSTAICFIFDKTSPVHAYSNPFAPYWDAASQLIVFLIIALLLSHLKDRLRIEKQLARIDALTGVMNGRGFIEASQQLITLAARHGRPTILAYIDLDNFREMNEAFGHSEGEKALQTIGQLFLESLRKTDVVGRLGGNEFALLLPETDASGARTKLGKLKNELTNKSREYNWPIRFNIGFVSFDIPPSSIDEAFKFAESLINQIKNNGKSNIVFEHFPKNANAEFQLQGNAN